MRLSCAFGFPKQSSAPNNQPTANIQQRDMLKGGKESYGVAGEGEREGEGGGGTPKIRSRVLMFGNHKAASGLRRRGGRQGIGARQGDVPDQTESGSAAGISQTEMAKLANRRAALLECNYRSMLCCCLCCLICSC